MDSERQLLGDTDLSLLTREIQVTTEEESEPETYILPPPRFENVVSTGSTLLDLAISGSIVRGGGIPGGIIVEISGPPAAGKSSIITEIAGSIQRKGGQVLFKDPEGRLDKEYAEIFGMTLQGLGHDYEQPDTVLQAFKDLYSWKPKDENVINGICVDSIAALSTEMELGEDGDKMGMRKAKELSQELRKTCRKINQHNWLVVCTNQLRSGTSNSSTTTGGKGIPYYASIRLDVRPVFGGGGMYIEDKVKLPNFVPVEPEPEVEDTKGRAKQRKPKEEKPKEETRTVGVRSTCEVIKSTVDAPYRTCEVSIMFNVGLDDVRENLIYLKDKFRVNKYSIDGNLKEDAPYKSYVSLNAMCDYVVENELEAVLREKVIYVWEAIDAEFKKLRRIKRRW